MGIITLLALFLVHFIAYHEGRDGLDRIRSDENHFDSPHRPVDKDRMSQEKKKTLFEQCG